ncbi:Imm32 family immunity protein [Piscinibacter gummiphilus]|uniref:Uncharacterized protein n=1 Tax=Piscinibacter gummiphilus TaxID=946333 RepID=A0A1W6LC38_9BURK|nr:hypothetical protein [Piscinibacter gummiphilus]ARN21812.1 hypothetical protein A4W93_18985 [Piscinibacter gummiphilus]ATU66498.1 hypothetical protein CPZ87_19070 [Piscinibacter gummiphilus]GLS95320.1 hypothetical protein GCM10007918_26120 [Piscinibacter gummiphilus]
MKIYGYATGAQDAALVSSTALAEITLCATPGELRRMAQFMVACAEEMERMGEAYDHVHLGDRMKEFDGTSPHVVVCGAEPDAPTR